MTSDPTVETGMMVPEPKGLGEETIIREACWAEIHRLHHTEHRSITEIARQLDLDRKTVRRALQQARWQPSQRPAREDMLLAAHAAWLRTRAPQVRYSAQILFQELRQQQAQWLAEIADVRVHGTTHERPLDRFQREQPSLRPTAGQPSFRLEAPHARIVADDYLVSLGTNRYSVPFTLIGQPVEVCRRNGQLEITHRGQLAATHAELPGKYQMRILPKHGPGAVARTARQQHSTPPPAALGTAAPDVEGGIWPSTRRSSPRRLPDDARPARMPPGPAPAAAPHQEPGTARGAPPGGRRSGAPLRRLPRPAPHRGGDLQDRQARHHADASGPLPVRQGPRRLRLHLPALDRQEADRAAGYVPLRRARRQPGRPRPPRAWGKRISPWGWASRRSSGATASSSRRPPPSSPP